MRLDGLTLLELSKEIDYSCSGMRVDRISSVGPWAVLFGMQDGSGILVSSSPKGARAVVTEAKAPMRSDASGFVMVLRKHLEGGRLVKALKRPLENSLSLCFRGWDDDEGVNLKYLVLEAVGARSNMFFIDGSGTIIDSLKKSKDARSSLRPDMPGERFEPLPAFELPDALSCSKEAFVAAALRTKAARPGIAAAAAIAGGLYGISEAHVKDLMEESGCISSDIAEVAAASYEALRARQRAFKDRVWPCMIIDDGGKSRISLVLAQEAQGNKPSKCLEALLRGIDEAEGTASRKALTSRELAAALERAENKLGIRTRELAQAEEGDRYRIWADAILASMHELNGKVPQLAVLTDYSEEEPGKIEVPMDPDRSAAKNAEGYYKKYNRSKRAKKMLLDLIESSRRELEYLTGVKDALDRAEQPKVVDQIREELAHAGYLKGRRPKQADTKKRKAAVPQPAEYTLPTGHRLFVGRNNAQNDELTFSIANPWDLWFHVKGAPGSHVVLRLDRGETPQDSAIEEAARIALENSSLRGLAKAEVDYTEVRRVKKIKGGLPGAVTFTGQKTVSVKLRL